MSNPRRLTRQQRLVMLVMTLAVVVPSMYGFGSKFIEFVELYRGDVEGAFAISPILNYLLASLGFLCLFGWAALHGMFRDVEGPKQTMLDNEALLDRDASYDQLGYALLPRRAAPGLDLASDRHRFRNAYDQE